MEVSSVDSISAMTIQAGSPKSVNEEGEACILGFGLRGSILHEPTRLSVTLTIKVLGDLEESVHVLDLPHNLSSQSAKVYFMDEHDFGHQGDCDSLLEELRAGHTISTNCVSGVNLQHSAFVSASPATDSGSSLPTCFATPTPAQTSRRSLIPRSRESPTSNKDMSGKRATIISPLQSTSLVSPRLLSPTIPKTPIIDAALQAKNDCDAVTREPHIRMKPVVRLGSDGDSLFLDVSKDHRIPPDGIMLIIDYESPIAKTADGFVLDLGKLSSSVQGIQLHIDLQGLESLGQSLKDVSLMHHHDDMVFHTKTNTLQGWLPGATVCLKIQIEADESTEDISPNHGDNSPDLQNWRHVGPEERPEAKSAADIDVSASPRILSKDGDSSAEVKETPVLTVEHYGESIHSAKMWPSLSSPPVSQTDSNELVNQCKETSRVRVYDAAGLSASDSSSRNFLGSGELTQQGLTFIEHCAVSGSGEAQKRSDTDNSSTYDASKSCNNVFHSGHYLPRSSKTDIEVEFLLQLSQKNGNSWNTEECSALLHYQSLPSPPLVLSESQNSSPSCNVVRLEAQLCDRSVSLLKLDSDMVTQGNQNLPSARLTSRHTSDASFANEGNDDPKFSNGQVKAVCLGFYEPSFVLNNDSCMIARSTSFGYAEPARLLQAKANLNDTRDSCGSRPPTQAETMQSLSIDKSRDSAASVLLVEEAAVLNDCHSETSDRSLTSVETIEDFDSMRAEVASSAPFSISGDTDDFDEDSSKVEHVRPFSYDLSTDIDVLSTDIVAQDNNLLEEGVQTPYYDSVVKVDITPGDLAHESPPVITCFFVLTFTQVFCASSKDEVMEIEIRAPTNTSIVMARVNDETVTTRTTLIATTDDDMTCQVVTIHNPGFRAGEALCMVVNCILKDFTEMTTLQLPRACIAAEPPLSERVLLTRKRYPLYVKLDLDDLSDWHHVHNHKEVQDRWRFERINHQQEHLEPLRFSLARLAVVQIPANETIAICTYMRYHITSVTPQESGDSLLELTIYAQIRRPAKLLYTDPVVRFCVAQNCMVKSLRLQEVAPPCFRDLSGEIIVMDTEETHHLSCLDMNLRIQYSCNDKSGDAQLGLPTFKDLLVEAEEVTMSPDIRKVYSFDVFPGSGYFPQKYPDSGLAVYKDIGQSEEVIRTLHVRSKRNVAAIDTRQRKLNLFSKAMLIMILLGIAYCVVASVLQQQNLHILCDSSQEHVGAVLENILELLQDSRGEIREHLNRTRIMEATGFKIPVVDFCPVKTERSTIPGSASTPSLSVNSDHAIEASEQDLDATTWLLQDELTTLDRAEGLLKPQERLLKEFLARKAVKRRWTISEEEKAQMMAALERVYEPFRLFKNLIWP